MSLTDLLGESPVWERFYRYKESLAVPKRFTSELRVFTDEKRYLPVLEEIKDFKKFPLPARSVINKTGSDKRRVIYTYPEPENTVLKLLTYLILRKYDSLFDKGLYSFRPGKTAKDAVRYLLNQRDIRGMYAYKADIHDYFNSIPVEKLLPKLKTAVGDDEQLYGFLSYLLSERYVLERSRPVCEQKGIMAGTPLSSFYANLFLADLDRHFSENSVIYARYSDDMILFAPTEEECMTHRDYMRGFLAENGLTVNTSKEILYTPDDGFVFLGFSCVAGTVDIAPVTKKKLKQKMRRKRDALARWASRNGMEREKAAKAFIRIFNRKLLDSPEDNELSWSRWFFPLINTDAGLREIDIYAQDCIRYLISGKHTKSRYNVRYDQMKALGYRSLVNEFYADKKK